MYKNRCPHCRKPGTYATLCGCRDKEMELDYDIPGSFGDGTVQTEVIEKLLQRIRSLEDRVAALEGYPSKED